MFGNYHTVLHEQSGISPVLHLEKFTQNLRNKITVQKQQIATFPVQNRDAAQNFSPPQQAVP